MSSCLECKKTGTKECPIYDQIYGGYNLDWCDEFEEDTPKTESYTEGIKGLTEGTSSYTNIKDIESIISGGTIELPKYKAQIDMGGFIAQVNHTFTEKQIEHIRDYFGWKVKNYE